MAYHHEYLDDSTLLTLQRMLYDLNNPFIEAFLPALERIRRYENITLNLTTIQNSNLDHRKYNYPTAAEVLALANKEQVIVRSFYNQGRGLCN